MKNIVRYAFILLALGYGVVASAQVTLTLGAVVDTDLANKRWKYSSVTCTSSNPITSIIISMVNNTVYSAPTTPTKDAYTSAGHNPQTVLYVFRSPISVAQVNTFIGGLIFQRITYPETPNDTPYVNITVDANPTKLPSGAKVTVWDDHPDGSTHYYVWVASSGIDYKPAYDAAKNCWFQGMRGYIPTITDSLENRLLTEISKTQGWSAGARTPDPIADERSISRNPSMVNSNVPYDPATAQQGSSANYYRWICGPETGFAYYYHSPDGVYQHADRPGHRSPMNGAFLDWAGAGTEPNNADSSNHGENVMEVNYTDWKWNDYFSTNNSIAGYFIEFGGNGQAYSVTSSYGTANYPPNPKYYTPTAPTGETDQWHNFSPGNKGTTATTFKTNAMRSNVLVIE